MGKVEKGIWRRIRHVPQTTGFCQTKPRRVPKERNQPQDAIPSKGVATIKQTNRGSRLVRF
eukprot:5466464-Amphidinium_carterae.1